MNECRHYPLLLVQCMSAAAVGVAVAVWRSLSIHSTSSLLTCQFSSLKLDPSCFHSHKQGERDHIYNSPLLRLCFLFLCPFFVTTRGRTLSPPSERLENPTAQV
ncbi:hypothetical protein ACQKWADRAFT_305825 [Trichoderma austrokoningii]